MSHNKQQEPQVTWAQAFRDIVIVSMEKGQLPVLAVFGILFALIWKLDSKDAYDLIVSIGNKLYEWCAYGYILFVLTLIGWFFTAKMLRRMHLEECDRVGREKSRLQEKFLNNKHMEGV